MAGNADQRVAEDDLQGQLRDLLCLAIVGDHLRWVLTGEGSAELAEWLSSASDAWRTWADEVAQQLVASGVAPDGRIRSLARDIPVNWVPPGWLEAEEGRALLANRLTTVREWAHYRRSQSTGVRGDSLDVVCSGFDEQLRTLTER